jgi:hypothetical protein
MVASLFTTAKILSWNRVTLAATLLAGVTFLDACGTGVPDGACAGGQTACGQCVDLNQDLLHCGSCNHACAQGEDCVSGACTCVGGGLDCNGVCVNVSSNPEHCGLPSEPSLFQWGLR